MAYFLRLLLTIAFVQIFIGSSNACSCVMVEKKDYCNVDWVSRVFIQDVDLVTITGFKYWKYTVKHVHIYKSSVQQLPTAIVTAEHGVSCGVDLMDTPNGYTEYLLGGGFYDNSTLKINSCSPVSSNRWKWTNGSWDREGAVNYLKHLSACGNITFLDTDQ